MNKIIFTLLIIVFALLVATPGRAESPPVSLAAEHAIRGDVDRSGVVNIFDLLAVLGEISGNRPVTDDSDLDSSGKTDIFDLLEWLKIYNGRQEPLEVIATIRNHLLVEPVVYSFSPFHDNEVRDQYHIYSNRGIVRAEFVLNGDTLTDTSGTSPVIIAADPDTIPFDPLYSRVFFNTPPIAWSIKVWDKFGDCASDSGVSQFVVRRPSTAVDGDSPHMGDEIEFPLILHGTNQCFGIEAYAPSSEAGLDTFLINLNPAGEDSVVYHDIEQLDGQILEQMKADESLWRSANEDRGVWVSIASERISEEKVNRLVLVTAALTPPARMVPMSGSWKLLSQLGFPEWKQRILYGIYDRNYTHDYKH